MDTITLILAGCGVITMTSGFNALWQARRSSKLHGELAEASMSVARWKSQYTAIEQLLSQKEAQLARAEQDADEADTAASMARNDRRKLQTRVNQLETALAHERKAHSTTKGLLTKARNQLSAQAEAAATENG